MGEWIEEEEEEEEEEAVGVSVWRREPAQLDQPYTYCNSDIGLPLEKKCFPKKVLKTPTSCLVILFAGYKFANIDREKNMLGKIWISSTT